jgi:hypothetical protein
MIKKIFLSFMLCLPLIANAEDTKNPAQNMGNLTKLYEVYWLGMHVGDLTTEVKKLENGLYQLSTHMKSLGLARKLSKYWSVTESTSKLNDDGTIEPVVFSTYSRLKKKHRKINIEFTGGTVASEAVNPPDNPVKRPAVASDLKQGAVDPHSAILLAYHKFRENLVLGNKRFGFNVYEGRRLHQMLFEIKGRVIKKIYGNKLRVIHVRMSRNPLAGFTGREIERMQKEEPVFDIFVSDDNEKLPILFEASAPIGTAKIILAANCRQLKGCKADENIQTAFGQLDN